MSAFRIIHHRVGGIEATIIADSISPDGKRITSVQIKAHRFILAEINTHKQLSRSYRSSRAVPVAKMLKEVRENPAEPVVWLRNVAGMQGGEPMSPEEEMCARECWRAGARMAADHAELLSKMGLHKQWANRVVEPYLFAHGILTATEWANMFTLRRHPDAQPEFRELAAAIWDAMRTSTPTLLQYGEWHLPYFNFDPALDEEIALMNHLRIDPTDADQDDVDRFNVAARKISTARCARASYRAFDGTLAPYEDDFALHDRLVGAQPVHASPAEHQATPDFRRNVNIDDSWDRPKQHGNLVGWIQYRKTIPGECVTEYHG